MAISAEDVKKLRDQTGAGMMDCKKALTESNGDFERAVAILREKGIAVAAKRESRAANEGMIGSYITDDYKTGTLAELNCETTFVAKTDEFVNLAQNFARQTATAACDSNVDCLLDMPYIEDPSSISRQVLSEIMGKVGEKMGLARITRLDVDGVGMIGSYIHMGGQIAVLVEIKCESEATVNNEDFQQLGRDLAMHISWSNPDYLTRDEISQDAIGKERDIHRQWAIKEGKPENIIERIVDGRMKDFYSRVVLLEQPFIKDEEQSIQRLVDGVSKKTGDKISVAKFVRFRVGETAGE